MKHHKEVDALISQAESERRCAYGLTKAHRSALARRVQAHELKRVFPNMYARPDYWDLLQPDERTRHRARTIHLKHPDWVFAGITAAAIHGFDHQWHLHADSVTITATTQGNNASTTHVKRIFAPDCATAGGCCAVWHQSLFIFASGATARPLTHASAFYDKSISPDCDYWESSNSTCWILQSCLQDTFNARAQGPRY